MEGESQNAQDARVENLWQTLDTKKEGQLDLAGLQKGLRKIDHPLKNANSLLKDVLNVVDTSGDGRIQYSEFRTFVEQTEKELWQLFKSIDRDHNGQLDKGELQAAFNRAGLLIPNSKLDQFFSEVDTNCDGVISFDEWRNFLLFIPAQAPGLRAILSYYSSTVTLSPEGDVGVSNEAVHGLGRHQFLTTFFGMITSITSPPRQIHVSEKKEIIEDSESDSFPWDPGEYPVKGIETSKKKILPEVPVLSLGTKSLKDDLPVGYFLAGGIAGVVSRTLTAPLDRLKVYLIAQTGVKGEAVEAVKSVAPLKATKLASRPLYQAMKQLWAMGGIRSLFAGNGLNVLKVMPESAVKFGSYEVSKRFMCKLEGHDDPKALWPVSQFFAAGFGGTVSQFVIYPFDTLKFRMQNETVAGGLRGNALIIATFKKMRSTSGIRSFYRGLPLGLLGMFPYSGVDLTTFEYLKRFFTARNARERRCHEEDAAPGNAMTAAIGGFSGAFGASVVYPVNLIRTRLQSQGTAIHPPTYTGVMDVMRRTYKLEGMRGFYKGITPNLFKVVPAVAITYVVYDNSKKVLGLK